MAEIWIWNSMATRKRSPSDGFLENGLALLKGHLKKDGHNLKVIDWQKDVFYDQLCPIWLRSLNRVSTYFMFWLGSKCKVCSKLYFPLFNLFQELVSVLRKQRMKKSLQELADEIIENKVKIFGVKIWYGEAFLWADWLARYIKEKDPSLILVAGGFHVTLYEEDLLKNSAFDLGVVSQGEKPLNLILDIVDRNKNAWSRERVLKEIKAKIEAGELKNMIYRDQGKVKLSQRYTPEIAEKALPEFGRDSMKGKVKVHVLLDSLGCPWGRCNFCVHSHFYPQFCPRSVEDIISEMKYMIKKGVGLFRFAGSETPPVFAAKIGQAIIDRGLKVKYSIACRPVRGVSQSEEKYHFLVDKFRLMLRSGLCAVFMGGESGSDAINKKVMLKGVERLDIIKTAQAFREAQKDTGLKAYLSMALIYPSPLIEGISMEKVFEENISLIKEASPDSAIISPCFPFKKTNWYKRPKDFGFSISQGFINKIIQYEYVLYKPPSLWPSFEEVKVMGLSFKEALEECGRFRRAVESKGISSDLTDELFLMFEAAGYSGRAGLRKFKKETSLDLASSDYRSIKRINNLANAYSQKLAKSNFCNQ